MHATHVNTQTLTKVLAEQCFMICSRLIGEAQYASLNATEPLTFPVQATVSLFV